MLLPGMALGERALAGTLARALSKRARALLLVACVGVCGCAPATIGDPDAEKGASEQPQVELSDEPSPTTRFRRLTHEEWRRTVIDLFGTEKHLDGLDELRPDARTSGFLFENSAEALEVDNTLWAAYQRAAKTIAERVAADSATVEALLGDAASLPEEERAEAFVATLGGLAFRRPLSEEQKARYLALFELGTTAYDEAPGFEGGARLLVEALLQSPHFLYRVESSADEVGGVVRLDAHERAQRLSYFLWGTMPDTELRRAADEGELDDTSGVAAQVERMLGDPRAIDVVWSFHRQLLDVARYKSIAPSSAAFPDVARDLGASAAQETELFVRNLAAEGGGLWEMLSSTTTFVDATLAQIYGLEGTFGDEFERVTLPSSQRAGVLTQVGFLASHATSVDPDPIHRGVFIAKRLACTKIAAPPDDVPPLPPAGDKSNRALVADHTEQEGTACRHCHATIINPLGFPFETYDAVGAHRTEDRGHPVDSSSRARIDDGYVEVADAVELSEALAQSADVAECYARHWVELAHGRATGQGDSRVIADMAELLSTRSVGMLDLLTEIAVSKAFLNRSTEVE